MLLDHSVTWFCEVTWNIRILNSICTRSMATKNEVLWLVVMVFHHSLYFYKVHYFTFMIFFLYLHYYKTNIFIIINSFIVFIISY